MIGSSRREDVERHRAVVGVDDRLDRIAQVVAAVEGGDRALIGLAVGIVRRAGVAVEDVGVVIAVGDDVGVAIEGEEGREPLDPLDHVAADQDPALRA